MSLKHFDVLAEIYRILGQFTPDDIKRASSRRDISDNIRLVLRGLLGEALEHEIHESLPEARTRKPKSQPMSGQQLSPLHPNLNIKIYRNQLTSFLSNPKRFPDKNSLFKLLDSLGQHYAFSSRSSRNRVISKIVQLSITDPKFRESLYSKVSSTLDSQTEGWLDLILRNR